TGNGMRDNHLRGPDFLDCSKFPEAVFRLDRVKGRQVSGILTLKGVPKPVACEADESAGLIRGRCVLDRRDFGISYQSALNPISHNVTVVFALRVR
ncbi:MAG TPA: YceI family protein, partial [Leptospiraceae bacterium]|nr:YceI family protein [Leptospiraceae bacterium]